MTDPTTGYQIFMGFILFILVVAVGTFIRLIPWTRHYEEIRPYQEDVPDRPSLAELEQQNLDAEHHTLPQFALGKDPSHCPRCAKVAELRAKQAACPHDSRIEIRTMGGTVDQYCDDCGVHLPPEPSA